MVALKVETDIITSITSSLIGMAVILVIMYVNNTKTYVIGFICNKCHSGSDHTQRYFPVSDTHNITQQD